MKRLLAILIAVLLPLQLVWGMAAGYCQHEQVAVGGGHFGHHRHEHADAQHGSKHEGNKAGKAAWQSDLDCTGCHASTPAVVPELSAQALHPESACHQLNTDDGRPPSAPQRAPDRPQWMRLA